MVMVMVMRRRKCGGREEQSEGEQEELLHAEQHDTKPRPLRMARKGVDGRRESD
jgi:hypothetical protein